MAFSHGEFIALWTGAVIFLLILSCIFFKLCQITIRTAIQNYRPRHKKKRLSAQEKKVNRILSNQNVREILQSRAVTAINSQENRGRNAYSSQFSLDSVATVPDLTDRVIRVSFAPEGHSVSQPSTSQQQEDSPQQIINQVAESGSISDLSIGGRSNPPAYDSLSTHSRISTPPPEYATAVTKNE